MWALWPILIVAGLALTLLVTEIGRSRGSLTLPVLVALASLLVLWIVGEALRKRGWRDIDGWVDCSPACSGWHLTGALTFWAPPICGLFLVVAAIAFSALERRSKRR